MFPRSSVLHLVLRTAALLGVHARHALGAFSAAGLAHESLRVNGESALNATISEPVNVEVLFIRHGHACHNLFADQSIGGLQALLKRGGYKDAPLTDCGIQNSARNGVQLQEALRKKSWDPDLVASSDLLRAMETAVHMFPGRKIVPLPFVSEIGRGGALPKMLRVIEDWWPAAANVPATIDKQLGFLRDPGQEDQESPINWTYSEKYREARGVSSYEKFRSFLSQDLLPELLKTDSVAATMNTIRIAVVSHGAFLRDVLGTHFKCTLDTHNNVGRLVKYEYNASELSLQEVVTSGGGLNCRDPLEGDELAARWREKHACPRDYARCVVRDPEAMDATAEGFSEWVRRPSDIGNPTCCVDA